MFLEDLSADQKGFGQSSVKPVTLRALKRFGTDRTILNTVVASLCVCLPTGSISQRQKQHSRCLPAAAEGRKGSRQQRSAAAEIKEDRKKKRSLQQIALFVKISFIHH